MWDGGWGKLTSIGCCICVGHTGVRQFQAISHCGGLLTIYASITQNLCSGAPPKSCSWILCIADIFHMRPHAPSDFLYFPVPLAHH